MARTALLFIALAATAAAYKPVFFMHGISGSAHDWHHMLKFVQQSHPGTPTYALAVYENDNSTVPLYTQLAGIYAAIDGIIEQNGYTSVHLVCHSQGALICRTLLQEYSLPVDTLISLSGPQMGQFGLAGEGDWIEERFPGITTDLAWIYLYTPSEQKSFSAANYWHDPSHEAAYLKSVVFLPVMNNQTYNPKSEAYKANFLKLQNVYFYGSPDDGVIAPWQSALFGYWTPHKAGIIDMVNSSVYIDDYIGLRTLDESGRLHMVSVPGVPHNDWLTNQPLYTQYIDPYLT